MSPIFLTAEYFLLFALPLSGWLFSSADGISVSWFGVVALPDLLAADKRSAEVLLRLHVVLALMLASVIGAHVAAALWHHFVRRDTVLVRMLPGRCARLEAAERCDEDRPVVSDAGDGDHRRVG